MALFAMTELEAVNIILAGIGEAEVTSIEDTTIEDAQMALSILRQVSRELQTVGWHFNTDYDYPLTPNVDDKIAYPVGAVHVDPMPSSCKDYVKRGGFLYDREDRTFLFTDVTEVKCKIVWLLDFEDLPQACRDYITYKAARRFAKNVMGDEATVQFSAQDEAEAKAMFLRDEAQRADHNMLTSTHTAFRVLMRRRPWYSGV